MATPAFPITVRWITTGEVGTYGSLGELEGEVEHVDTATDAIEVTDAHGRRVALRVYLLRTEVFETIESVGR
jgi:hypothetical protein